MAPASLSFTPWARSTFDSTSLKDVLARVNLERGHFRGITEASLQEEIATEGALDVSGSSSDDDDENDDARPPARKLPEAREDLYQARTELIEHVRYAEQEMLMALDFVSLLQTTHQLNPAATTISPVLRSSVPTASLGADVWKASPGRLARDAQDAIIATKVRMESLTRSADSLLAAATRLQCSARRETQYWQEVLSVAQRGWSVSKIPRRGHMLGVHFGFRGTAPEFAHRHTAALVSDINGAITLERGIGTQRKAVRVVIRSEGRIVGVSKLPVVLEAGESMLETQIRYARDSVYDEELHHEMIRESRLLASEGVVMRGPNVTLTVLNADSKPKRKVVSFELLPLDPRSAPHLDLTSSTYDSLAQTMVLGARLLLGQSHRDRLRRKAQPPDPLTENVDDLSVSPILRPLMLLLQCHEDIEHVNTYILNLVSLLKHARITTTHTLLMYTFPTRDMEQPPVPSLMAAFTQSLSSQGSLSILLPSGTAAWTVHLGIEIAPTQSSTSTYCLTTHTEKQHKFHSLHDFLAATDDFVASALTQALYTIATKERWRCDTRECRLSELGGVLGGEKVNVLVEVKSSERTSLVLRGGSGRELAWTTDGVDGDRIGFWQGWRDISKTVAT